MTKESSKFQAKFVFNPEAPDDVVISEKRKKAAKIESLIDDLKMKATVCGAPLFTSLIEHFPPGTTWDEVEILGKALQKYATMKPRLDTLREEIQVIDIARANMNLLASVFADADALEAEVDAAIANITNPVKTDKETPLNSEVKNSEV